MFEHYFYKFVVLLEEHILFVSAVVPVSVRILYDFHFCSSVLFWIHLFWSNPFEFYVVDFDCRPSLTDGAPLFLAERTLLTLQFL